MFTKYRGRPTGAGRYRTPSYYSYFYLYPSNYRFYCYGYHHNEDSDKGEEEIEEKEPEIDTLIIKELDLCVKENTFNHHTDGYEITESNVTGNEPQLVVRRGQSFEVKVTLDREYEKEKDEFIVCLTLGNLCKPSKGTEQKLSLRSGNLLKGKWCAAVKSREGNVLTISLQSPSDALIGKWSLSIDTKVKKEFDEDESTKINKYKHGENIYILFNPWCKEDQVFMSDEIWRDEAVLNEFGKIYTGNWKQIGHKPWNFGQFEDTVLDAALYLLDEGRLAMPSRGNPAKIIRKLSAMVNDCDDNGVLSGNWSGDYDGGCSPTSWTGSVAILEEYMDSRKPVKFGQCWVFSGLCTSLCRALGIPARSVTNFASAHDCDGSVTIDKYWKSTGEPIPKLNDDSVWNFHVWNEAWMSRPDLPTTYSGWQAFDATPQETSDGVYQAGPCSVAAIKQGMVGFPVDGSFIFAEVNADKVHWVAQKDGSWKTSLDKTSVGRKISTKHPRNKKPGGNRARWSLNLIGDDIDRCDITREYKFKEGCEQERAAVYRANQGSTKPGIYDKKEDVKFELEIKDNILIGNNFEIKLKMQNTSREKRTVRLKFSLCPCFYTGVTKDPIKVKDFEVEIPAIRTHEASMRVTHEEYLHYIVDQAAFKTEVGAHVEETDQIFNTDDDFRLRRPDVIIETQFCCQVHEEMEAVLKVINPMPVHLTCCEWQIEGPGVLKSKKIKERDIEPYETITVKVPFRPRRIGKRQIAASFNCKELPDVTGSHDLEVQSGDP